MTIKTLLKEFLHSDDFKRTRRLARARGPRAAELKARVAAFLRGDESLETFSQAVVVAVEATTDDAGAPAPVFGFGGAGTASFVEALLKAVPAARLEAELRRALAGIDLLDPSEKLRSFAAFVARTARDAAVGPDSNLHVGYATCFLSFCWHVLYDFEIPVFYGASHKGVKALIAAGAVEDAEYGSRDLTVRFRAFLRIARALRDLFMRVNAQLNFWTVDAFLEWYAFRADSVAAAAPEFQSQRISAAEVRAALAQSDGEATRETPAVRALPAAPARKAGGAGEAPPPVEREKPVERGKAAEKEPEKPRLAEVEVEKAAPAAKSAEKEPEKPKLAQVEAEKAAPAAKAAEKDPEKPKPATAAKEPEKAKPAEKEREKAKKPEAAPPPPDRAPGAAAEPERRRGLTAEGKPEFVAEARRALEGAAPAAARPDAIAELARATLLAEPFLRELEAVLRARGQLAIEGPSGVGKTYLARRLAAAFAGDARRVVFLELHAAYRYEDLIEARGGHGPPTGENGNGAGAAVPGILRTLADRAAKEPGERFVLVLDDLARVDAAAVLGECFALFDDRDAEVLLPFSRAPFRLPKNLFFIATARPALHDAALRRRFPAARLGPDAALLGRFLEAHTPALGWLAQVFATVNQKLAEDADPRASLGHGPLMRRDLDEAELARIWRFDVAPLVEGAVRDPLRRAAYELEALRAGPR
jgi:hypothetical protein